MAVLTVTTTADSGAGSLRAAIAAANDGDVIQFDATVFPAGTTTAILLSSTLTVAKTIVIDGDGRVSLDGQSAIRVISLGTANKSPHIKSLTILNGSFSNGAGLLLQGGEPIVSNCTIENCVASTNAGGVYGINNAVATLNNCVIRYNTAGTSGGGVYANNTSGLTLNNCTISSNRANTTGGGVHVANTAAATFNNCAITYNSVIANGGALFTNGGTIAFNSSTATGNTTEATDKTLVGAVINAGTVTLNDSVLEVLRTYGGVSVNISDGVSTVGNLRLVAQSGVLATVTISDGAALTVTTAATIGSATLSGNGRGYLATASGVDISAATLNNVVACAYGAGLTSFAINDAGAIWTADDLTTTILLETRDDGGDWDTLTQAAGGSYVASFNVGTVARAFDGARFWVAEISAYWQVASFVVANNGGGGAGDSAACWVVDNKTITPNISGV